MPTAALTCYFVVQLMSPEGVPGRRQIAPNRAADQKVGGSNPSEPAIRKHRMTCTTVSPALQARQEPGHEVLVDETALAQHRLTPQPFNLETRTQVEM